MNTLQEQRDIQDIVFGPLDSRRFGKSLGVNPLPRGSRLCNFDCIYCECATANWPMEWDLRPQFPTPQEVRRALLEAVDRIAAEELDSIAITGNGEPTLSPHLDAIVDVVTEFRDRDWPQARTVILTNGSTCGKASVRNAIAKLDERIVKFDAGTNWILEQLNRPHGRLRIQELRWQLSLVSDIVVQSMFVHGPIDNTTPAQVEAWTECLRLLKPASVQIYSLDRFPAKSWVQQVPRKTLDSIAEYVETTAGVPVHVY